MRASGVVDAAMYVDSHCHLSFPELRERLDSIRTDMAAAGVDRALCICTTLEEFEDVHALAREHANFWCSVGVHPDTEDMREPTVQDLAIAHRLQNAGTKRQHQPATRRKPLVWKEPYYRVTIRYRCGLCG